MSEGSLRTCDSGPLAALLRSLGHLERFSDGLKFLYYCRLGFYTWTVDAWNSQKEEMSLSNGKQGFLIMALLVKSY